MMLSEFRHHFHRMGSAFELIVVADSATSAQTFFDAGVNEITRIEALLTEFKEGSATWRINHSTDTVIKNIPPEVYELIHRCLRISRITNGCFDITIGPLKKLYSFKRQQGFLPSPVEIRKILPLVGAEKLTLLPDFTLQKATTGMQISFAAVGKGYAADCVRKIWKEMGCSGGVINASGDLCVLGRRSDGSEWMAGIPHPDKQRMLLKTPMPSVAVATSGNYEQYFEVSGKKYGHTLHPKTGLPVTGLQSASIFSPSAELSDALATAVTVMDIRTSLHFLQQLPDTWCLFLDEHEQAYSNLPAQAIC